MTTDPPYTVLISGVWVHCHTAQDAVRLVAAYTAHTEPRVSVSVVHGLSCRIVPHDDPAGGYLHSSDDDTPYDVDGVLYCGRCHEALS